MALILPTPEKSWAEQRLTLGGFDYTFTYTFNDRDKRWRVSINLQEDVVISGVKIMEQQSLLGNYNLPLFDHGDIFCLRMEKDGLPVGRYNLGSDRAYSLVYLTNEELSRE